MNVFGEIVSSLRIAIIGLYKTIFTHLQCSTSHFKTIINKQNVNFNLSFPISPTVLKTKEDG